MSLGYLQLSQTSFPAMLQSYQQAIDQRQQNHARECRATIEIQRVWRGHRDRRYVQRLNSDAATIQRAYRCHAARQRRYDALLAQTHRQHAALVHDAATAIQSLARGHLSRRHVHNHKKRAAYLRALNAKSAALTHEASTYAAQQADKAKRENIRQTAARQQARNEELHHLLSTKSQKGVFRKSDGSTLTMSAVTSVPPKTPNDNAAIAATKSLAVDSSQQAQRTTIPVEDAIKQSFVKRQARLKEMRRQLARTGGNSTSHHQQQQQQQQKSQQQQKPLSSTATLHSSPNQLHLQQQQSTQHWQASRNHHAAKSAGAAATQQQSVAQLSHWNEEKQEFDNTQSNQFINQPQSPSTQSQQQPSKSRLQTATIATSVTPLTETRKRTPQKATLGSALTSTLPRVQQQQQQQQAS